MYRVWYDKLHYPLIVVTLMLTAYGLLLQYSATHEAEGIKEVVRQSAYAAFGILLVLPLLLVDYKLLPRAAPYIYGLVLLFLVAVMVVGQHAMGAQRWISLGPIGSFQPSEIAKLGLIVTLSSFFARQGTPRAGQSQDRVAVPGSWRPFLLAGLHMAPPTLLIMLQPDLGTAMVLCAVTLGLLFVVGYNPLYLAGLVAAAGALLFRVLHDYQRRRLLIFLDPHQDPKGGGWNIIQSLIAVGSGGLFGKGLLAGTQTQLKFVPEHHTDFIFTVLAEEIGFVGGLILFVLYFLLLWFGTRIAMEAKDSLGKLIGVGIVMMFFCHIVVNVGMTMGIMPITGIPLLFISSGGSALVTNLLAVGLLLNIHLRKDTLLP